MNLKFLSLGIHNHFKIYKKVISGKLGNGKKEEDKLILLLKVVLNEITNNQS